MDFEWTPEEEMEKLMEFLGVDKFLMEGHGVKESTRLPKHVTIHFTLSFPEYFMRGIMDSLKVESFSSSVQSTENLKVLIESSDQLSFQLKLDGCHLN